MLAASLAPGSLTLSIGQWCESSTVGIGSRGRHDTSDHRLVFGRVSSGGGALRLVVVAGRSRWVDGAADAGCGAVSGRREASAVGEQRQAGAMTETYPQPSHGWTCFHCGETFTTVGAARDHFGEDMAGEPGCRIRVQVGEERGLLMALRKAEAQVSELRAESWGRRER